MRFESRAVALLIIILSAIAFDTSPAGAVILYKSATRNLSAPTGALANSGWQYEGEWSGFLGTAIAKQYFITASHFGGTLGNPFTLDGVDHTTLSMWDDPNSDLRIYKVKGALPGWASLYTGTSEVGQSVTMFGRGTQRGRGVIVNGVNKGWKWGAEDGKESWGTNVISDVARGTSDIGELLAMNFDARGTSNEGALSRGDSGGGVFIQNGSKWQLAGVNYSANGPFALSAGAATFDASVFDRGGLWAQATGFVQDKTKNLPGASYSTRVSDHIEWINDVLAGRIAASRDFAGGGTGVPEPSASVLTTLSVFGIASRRRRSRR